MKKQDSKPEKAPTSLDTYYDLRENFRHKGSVPMIGSQGFYYPNQKKK